MPKSEEVPKEKPQILIKFSANFKDPMEASKSSGNIPIDMLLHTLARFMIRGWIWLTNEFFTLRYGFYNFIILFIWYKDKKLLFDYSISDYFTFKTFSTIFSQTIFWQKIVSHNAKTYLFLDPPFFT